MSFVTHGSMSCFWPCCTLFELSSVIGCLLHFYSLTFIWIGIIIAKMLGARGGLAKSAVHFIATIERQFYSLVAKSGASLFLSLPLSLSLSAVFGVLADLKSIYRTGQ